MGAAQTGTTHGGASVVVKILIRNDNVLLLLLLYIVRNRFRNLCTPSQCNAASGRALLSDRLIILQNYYYRQRETSFERHYARDNAFTS